MPASTSPRIVSLVPSATEALALVGGLPLLVGRSHECDFPPGPGHVPTLTAPRVLGGSPAEIDSRVSRALSESGSLYHLDEPRLASLKPDVILTQTLCDVCSIDLASVERVVRRSCPGASILTLNPRGIEDVLDDVFRVAVAAGLDDAGTRAVVALRERLFAAAEFVNPYDDGPPVAFLEWTDPLFGTGHWTVQMIERAGGRHPLNPTAPPPRRRCCQRPPGRAAPRGQVPQVDAARVDCLRPGVADHRALRRVTPGRALAGPSPGDHAMVGRSARGTGRARRGGRWQPDVQPPGAPHRRCVRVVGRVAQSTPRDHAPGLPVGTAHLIPIGCPGAPATPRS